MIHFNPIAEDIFLMKPDSGAHGQSWKWICGLLTVSLQLWSVKETRHCYKCQHIHKFPKRFVCADLSGVNPVCKQTSSWKLNKSQHCYIPKSSTVPVSTSLERAVKLYPPRLLPINRNSSVHLTNIPRSIYKWWVLSIRAIVDSKYHLNYNIPINRHWLD